ncbi:MAG: hypothetical protein Q8P41_10030 [Pseudomonadota bacterium]|nr:hypothetical protein [Pseudomonadota bacterium]
MSRLPGRSLLLALLLTGGPGLAMAEPAPSAASGGVAASFDAVVADPDDPPPPPIYRGTDPQTLSLQVAIDYRVVYTRVRAEIDQLGSTFGLELVDDGSVMGDDEHDGVYTNRVIGPYARYATVRLYAEDATGEEALLYAGILTTADRDQNDVAWRVSDFGGQVRAERVAMAYPGGPDGVVDGLPVLIAFAWGGLVIFFVGTLVRRADPGP